MTEPWRGRRVLVTGATGLIGSALCARLVEVGATTVALVRDHDPQSELFRAGTIRALHIVNGQLEDLSTVTRALAEHEIDTVFHLGAEAIVGTAYRNPLQCMESNVRGTYNLMEACRQQRGLLRRIVVASSDKAYGESTVLPYTEEMPMAASNPYDVSKSCADLISRAYATSYELPVVVARFGNIYGGGDLNFSRLIPGTIRDLLADRAPRIRSDGKFLRDYLYIEDAVDGYLALAQFASEPGAAGQAFNLGPKSPHAVLEVVSVLRALLGREDIEPLILANCQGEIRDQHLASEKAKRLLGWSAAHSLEEGLRPTIDWYTSFLSGPLHV
ncbi:MAG: sugar dehydratase [Deltaproteobacteria bacterium CG2_30_63_29]|nr:MAG: sugar dehydratase [Deltaproteobacteria bacterium CG2_30_63_29]